MALTSITAYREVRSFANQDSDFTAPDLIGRKSDDVAINTFTQEVRPASDFDGPVNLQVGGYYFNEKIDKKNQIFFGVDVRPDGNALTQADSRGALTDPNLEEEPDARDGVPAP